MTTILNRFFDLFFSLKITLLLLLILGIAVASATFLESAYDAEAAKIIVFNTKWFELLLMILTINMIVAIIRFKMWKKKGVFIFHIGFIIVLIGSGISRYTGFDGQIIIQEGQVENKMFSSAPYLYLSVQNERNTYFMEEQKWFSEGTPTANQFSHELSFTEDVLVTIDYVDFKKNAIKTIQPLSNPDQNGNDYLVIIVPGEVGMDSLILERGEDRFYNGKRIGFESEINCDLLFSEKHQIIELKSTDSIQMMAMNSLNIGGENGTTTTRSPIEIASKKLYNTNDIQFVFKGFIRNSEIKYAKSSMPGKGTDVLTVNVQLPKLGYHKKIHLEGGAKSIRRIQMWKMPNNQMLSIGYGPKIINLPFSVGCDDFRLEKYPGSENPASFESDVTIYDGDNIEHHNIFMNRVLDYGGYRFFQSSYILGEKSSGLEQRDSTILSINHDLPGTLVTYIGYLLLAVGFSISLIGKKSRFRIILQKLKQAKTIALLFILTTFAFDSHAKLGEDIVIQEIAPEYIKLANRILVQERSGRFSALHTHARDVLKKISKKDEIGNYDATTVYLNMIKNPTPWYFTPIIYVKHDGVKKLLGNNEKYVSMQNFWDPEKMKTGKITLNTELEKYYQLAHQRKDGEKSTFDKELIKTIERYYVLESAIMGNMFRVLPSNSTENNRWLSFYDIEMNYCHPNELADHKKRVEQIITELTTNNDRSSFPILNDLLIHQRDNDQLVLPSETAVELEIMYNNLNLFYKLMFWLAGIGVIGLLIFFTSIFLDFKRLVKWTNKIIYYALCFMAAVYLFGLGLRWYIVGHAPWTNGYEALVFIGFTCLIAGLLFYKNTRFAAVCAAILTALILGIAHGANVDPSLTNLIPVLNSVWLVIHVAIMTSSYGFLGIGALMCLLNLMIYLFLPIYKDTKKLKRQVNELTLTAEMTFTVGLFLATIGMFLGGVWANESWGRYWGWDAKETWALVIVITYAILLHLRFIPKLRNTFLFNLLGFWMYSTVLMTYFGVNYYLVTGLHSYAQGDKAYLPPWASITIGVLALLTFFSVIQNMRYKRKNKA